MELATVLEKHKLWLQDSDTGEKADLQYAKLQGAKLQYANLRSADLRNADLRSAKLQGADLQGANLQGADLQGAGLPPPTMILLARWGSVPADITLELMRYDASNHTDPQRFEVWADGGECPYFCHRFQRAANFQEVRALYTPGPAKSAIELALLLLKMYCNVVE